MCKPRANRHRDLPHRTLAGDGGRVRVRVVGNERCLSKIWRSWPRTAPIDERRDAGIDRVTKVGENSQRRTADAEASRAKRPGPCAEPVNEERRQRFDLG